MTDNKMPEQTKVERCVKERYERGGAERRQRNKQGSMGEEDRQLYRRPQMTGQARDEEEEYLQLRKTGERYFSNSSLPMGS